MYAAGILAGVLPGILYGKDTGLLWGHWVVVGTLGCCGDIGLLWGYRVVVGISGCCGDIAEWVISGDI